MRRKAKEDASQTGLVELPLRHQRPVLSTKPCRNRLVSGNWPPSPNLQPSPASTPEGSASRTQPLRPPVSSSSTLNLTASFPTLNHKPLEGASSVPSPGTSCRGPARAVRAKSSRTFGGRDGGVGRKGRRRSERKNRRGRRRLERVVREGGEEGLTKEHGLARVAEGRREEDLVLWERRQRNVGWIVVTEHES